MLADDLHRMGWKAFQDLCAAVANDVLGRPVQIFLASRDGGRDGAFIGTWEGAPDTPDGKSTIQSKFIEKANARLTLSSLKSELPKAAVLAKQGLAEDYIVMTNAGVSGEMDAAICAAFQAAGVKQCRVFGGDWIVQQLRDRPRLRMLAPRVYGLADLTEFIDQRAYDQARRILSAMGEDLRCFVTTEAHRRSVDALHKHGFVLLLGDPASGKSTIAAILALGALDAGSVGAVRLTSADQLDRWNPKDGAQFLWIDDAFGSNQMEASKVDGWNAQLPLLRAAVKAGTRMVFTSRNYVWERAKTNLRVSQFPLFTESQVTINVQSLSENEKAQILYNHIRLGEQTPDYRKKLKPFLPMAATAPEFLPETARRLGSPFFTKNLMISEHGVRDFVERPVAFLKEILERLDKASGAAIALIFLHGASGVPSPVTLSPALDTVVKIVGVPQLDIVHALEAMNGSLTLRAEHADGYRWSYRHPTIADAYAELVRDSSEFVEIYLNGAKIERLLADVYCGTAYKGGYGAKVRVPTNLYPTLIKRLENAEFDSPLQRFLASRCDDELLREYVKTDPPIAGLVKRINSSMSYSSEIDLLARLHQIQLLPETIRLATVDQITDAALTWADGAIFENEELRSLFSEGELSELENRFRKEWLEDLLASVERWRSDYTSSDEAGHLRELKETIEVAARYFAGDADLNSAAESAYEKLDGYISDLESQIERRDQPEIQSSQKAPPAGLAAIFDDVDDE